MISSPIKIRSWTATPSIDVCLCGVGARTALGFNAMASAAAVRCGISGVGVHQAFVDKADEPMAFACDAALDTGVTVTVRMSQMLLSAVSEGLGAVSTEHERARIACWIGLPEPRLGLPAEIASSISAAASNAFGFSAIHVLQNGHAAGLMALQAAAQKISLGEADVCIAAGVDSYVAPETLDWLDGNGWLMSSTNRNGFPPGEAAGACLLASRSEAQRLGLPVFATLIAASTTIEPHAIRGKEVCVGEGLTAALRAVVAGLRLPQEEVTATYCDLNGERYRNEEFVYTLLRVQEAYVDAHDYLCPADCWGDVGAASGPLFAALAVVAMSRGYSKGVRPVLWAGSESGYRAALLLNLSQS
jgi:3-oxoacyl-[acyl-carrier-protein] synthase I